MLPIDRIWLKAYPAGVPAEIDALAYPSLVALCDEACRRYPGHRAFGSFGTFMSFLELARYARGFAAFLQTRAGLALGDRVAIMMPNLLQYPVAMLAVLQAGGVVVNINPQYTPRELRHQLIDSGAATIVILDAMLPVLADVIPETAVKTVIVTRVGDFLPLPKALLANFLARRARRPGGSARLPEAVAFADALQAGLALRFTPVAVGPADLAFLQYTGGTTGVSKGAMLTHGNMVANVLQANTWTNELARPGEEIIITALPLYHIFALTMNCFSFMVQGGMNYLIANPRDLRRFIQEMKRVPFTAITGVNTLFKLLVNAPEFAEVDFSRLRFTGGGGMATQRPVAEAWRGITGSTIIEGFGLTEASPVVCINPVDLAGFNGCIGLPVPSTDCRIVAADGRALSPGEAGELWVRGPQVMKGYWRRPDETAQVLTPDGWLKTGDIAVMREDGYFKIVDRKKDLILVSGFNVYPSEIEEVIAAHPGVLEAAAIGIPDEKTGEAVKVVVVRADPALSEGDLIAHCRDNLTAYKVPRHFAFASELPKSNVGKILRRNVREQYGGS